MEPTIHVSQRSHDRAHVLSHVCVEGVLMQVALVQIGTTIRAVWAPIGWHRAVQAAIGWYWRMVNEVERPVAPADEMLQAVELGLNIVGMEPSRAVPPACRVVDSRRVLVAKLGYGGHGRTPFIKHHKCALVDTVSNRCTNGSQPTGFSVWCRLLAWEHLECEPLLAISMCVDVLLVSHKDSSPQPASIAPAI